MVKLPKQVNISNQNLRRVNSKASRKNKTLMDQDINQAIRIQLVRKDHTVERLNHSMRNLIQNSKLIKKLERNLS